MKKIISAICTFALVLGCCMCLAGCGGDSKTVMNVSLNPEIEFVLDANDKVISVNALNDDGAVVIKGQVFVGKTADEALKLFVDISKEKGYLVANLDDQEIELSFSGSKAESLYNNLKTDFENYLDEKGITATISNALIDLDELGSTLKTATGMTWEEIEKLTHDQIVTKLAEAREETEDLQTQALKNYYYSSRKHQYMIEKMNYFVDNNKLGSFSESTFKSLIQQYSTICGTIDQAIYESYVQEYSPYQQARAALQSAKETYLEYRKQIDAMQKSQVTDAVLAILDTYKTAVDNAQSALNRIGYGTTAAVSNMLNNAYNAVVAALTAAGQDIENVTKDMQNYLNDKMAKFETSFKTKIAADITRENA